MKQQKPKRIVIFRHAPPLTYPGAPHMSWDPVHGILTALKEFNIEIHWRTGFRDLITPFVRSKGYRSFDGILSFCHLPRAWLELQDRIPAVCHIPRYAAEGANIVKNDDVHTGRLLAGHMADEGHTRIGYIADQADHYSRERLTGFRDALAARSIEPYTIDPAGILAGPPHRSFRSPSLVDREIIRNHARIVAAMRDMKYPAAYVCSSDQAAIAIASHAEQRGLSVPDDIALAAVNDTHIADGQVWRTSGITSIRQDGHHWGFMCIEMLIDIIDGRRPRTHQVTLVPPRLIIRSSSLKRSRESHSEDDITFMQGVRGFIEENYYRQNITEALACRFGHTPAYFLKKFGRLFDTKFTSYITSLKLEKAEFLIRSTRRPVTDILYASGFNSAPVFFTEFRKRYGATPAAYRRACSN